MSNFMIVMLIWAGGIQQGGAAAITGFETMQACEQSKVIVSRTRAIGSNAYMDCVRLPKTTDKSND